MTRAFWFYLRRSYRNRLVSMLKKAKQPKYALGLLFAVGYMVVFVLLPLLGASLGTEEIPEEALAFQRAVGEVDRVGPAAARGSDDDPFGGEESAAFR